MEDQGFPRPLLAGDQPWLSVPCLEIPTFNWGIINIILEKKTCYGDTIGYNGKVMEYVQYENTISSCGALFYLSQNKGRAHAKPLDLYTAHEGYIWYVHVFTPPLLKSDFMYTRKELTSGSQSIFFTYSRKVAESGQGCHLSRFSWPLLRSVRYTYPDFVIV